MSALAILSCRPNSHPFQERHISLHEPIKIGRSVARARPAPNNGIFDCKVLSRNHAMLWYENGNFYLQDTKSSNGTFINNQRLCKGGEESPARETYSSDLIQFGVDVMENNRRGEKITHGCIIATITLFHPDGREAKPVPFVNSPTPGITIQSQELYQLAQYLQEALHREKMLEQKLSSLQQLVQDTQESSETGWQALIDEDRLLSRLEVLENQLHTYSKNHSEDTLRQELVALQEDKLNYETTAKESLRRVLQEKLDAVRKLSELERSLANTEDECNHLKEMCEKTQEELQQLAEKYQDQLKEILELQEKLQEAERNHEEQVERVDREKQELREKLDDLVKQESVLSARVESLQADNDFAREQSAAMKAKLEAIKEPVDNEIEENDVSEKVSEGSDDNKLVDSDSHDSQTDIIPTSPKDTGPEDVEGKLKETQQQIEKYKVKLEEADKKLKESSDKIEQLQKELESAKVDSRQYLLKISTLEEKLKLSDMHMNQMMENSVADLNLQLKESHKQSDGSNDLIKSLQVQVSELEHELSIYKIPQSDKVSDTTLVGKLDDSHRLHNHIDNTDGIEDLDLDDDDESLKDLLQEARDLQRRAELELSRCKDELEETRLRARKAGEDNLVVRSQLLEAQQQAKDRSEMVVDLQDQLRKAESTTKEVKQQILDLRDRLLEEQELSRANQEEVLSLKRQLEQEKTKHKETGHELGTCKRQLQEAQQSAKQSHNEAEQLRNKVKHLQEDMESEKKEKTKDPHHHRLSYLDTHRQTAKTKAEFAALKEECAGLRKRIQAIEAEMKMSRKENLQLSSEYNKLQESYKQLEALKEKLETKETAWQSNLTDAQKETEQTKQELLHATDDLGKLRTQCEEYNVQITKLQGELANMSNGYRQLADKSKVLSFCSSIPLLMLLFAVLLAFYPTLSELTATTS